MSYLSKTTAKGRDYYKIEKSWRENGKTRHKVIYNIGPIQNLFALLPDYVKEEGDEEPVRVNPKPEVEIEIAPIRCRQHGASHLLWSISEWLGIRSLMAKFFPPKQANSIPRPTSLLLAAIHRACSPGSKAEFANWFSHTSLPDYLQVDPEIFTSQHMWEQMDEVSENELKAFEQEQFKTILRAFPEFAERLDCLSADFTNYFTYISSQNLQCTLAQLGHSKEGRSGQRIVNVAVVTSPLLGVPIVTMTYPGNDNDKTALSLFLTEIANRLKDIVNLAEITYVFDGGGTTEEALKLIPGHFITRGSLRSSPELYEVPLTSYEDICLDDGMVVPSYRTTAVQYGEERTVIVSLSDELRRGQLAETDKQISKFGEKIAELNARLLNPRSTTDKRLEPMKERIKQLLDTFHSQHLGDFIEVSYETEEVVDPVILRKYGKLQKQLKKKEGANGIEPVTIDGYVINGPEDIPKASIVKSISYTANDEKKKKMADRYYGKHMLVTDQDEWDTAHILTVYRNQETVERLFRDSKDTGHCSMRPLYHWTDQKIRVHVMVCYLGLTLAKVAQYLLKREYDFRITCSELLERLEHVQECLVIMKVNGNELKPEKVLSELNGRDAEVWKYTCKLLDYLKNNPIAVQEEVS